MAVPAALGMKNEQKRVRGIVRDSPIVATKYISLGISTIRPGEAYQPELF